MNTNEKIMQRCDIRMKKKKGIGRTKRPEIDTKETKTYRENNKYTQKEDTEQTYGEYRREKEGRDNGEAK